jgi:hypothetical protein
MVEGNEEERDQQTSDTLPAGEEPGIQPDQFSDTAAQNPELQAPSLEELSDDDLAARLNEFKDRQDLSPQQLGEYQTLLEEVARRGSLLPKVDSEQQRIEKEETVIVENMKRAFKLSGEISDDNNVRAILAVEIYRELSATGGKAPEA